MADPANEQDASDLPRIEAPDLDVEALRREIHARLAARRAAGVSIEAYAPGGDPLPAGAVLSRDVYESVRQLGLEWDKMGVEMVLTETHVPVIGRLPAAARLAHRARQALHELVLFYVNRQAARQVRFNDHSAHAMAALVRDLEAEIAELRARLAALEGRE